MHCAANPNYLSEVIAKGNFLIALLLVSRMFEFTSLTPQIEFIYIEFVIFKDTRKLLPNWCKIILYAVLAPPEAGSFLKVSTHLSPTVIPCTFHFLKWLLLNNNNWTILVQHEHLQEKHLGLEWDLVSPIHGVELNRNFGMIGWFSHICNMHKYFMGTIWNKGLFTMKGWF